MQVAFYVSIYGYGTIPKQGKDSYQEAKSFRPISLSNYLLKRLEKLLVEQMDLALEDHPIHKNQHGFQRGLSSETAISKTVNYIEKHINSGREGQGVFLDIQAAFDTICPKHIKASLLKHGADPDVAEFYYNYITHRHLGTIRSFKMHLFPLLFLVRLRAISTSTFSAPTVTFY